MNNKKRKGYNKKRKSARRDKEYELVWGFKKNFKYDYLEREKFKKLNNLKNYE